MAGIAWLSKYRSKVTNDSVVFELGEKKERVHAVRSGFLGNELFCEVQFSQTKKFKIVDGGLLKLADFEADGEGGSSLAALASNSGKGVVLGETGKGVTVACHRPRGHAAAAIVEETPGPSISCISPASSSTPSHTLRGTGAAGIKKKAPGPRTSCLSPASRESPSNRNGAASRVQGLGRHSPSTPAVPAVEELCPKRRITRSSSTINGDRPQNQVISASADSRQIHPSTMKGASFQNQGKSASAASRQIPTGSPKMKGASPQNHSSIASTTIRKTRHFYCTHGKRRTLCSQCGGNSLCHHGRQKLHCKECRPRKCKSFCKHGRQKSRCVKCGGVGKSYPALPCCLSFENQVFANIKRTDTGASYASNRLVQEMIMNKFINHERQGRGDTSFFIN